MNEDFSQLEDQLRALMPVAPSAGLERRVTESLRAPVRRSRCWWEVLGFHHPSAAFGWGIVVPSAAAAAAVTLFQVATSVPSPSAAKGTAPAVMQASSETVAAQTLASADTLSQVQDGAASSVVYQTNDEGVVLTSDQQPARQVRYLSEDTVKWRNPRTGADIEVSYPREEVVLTPIAAR